MYSNKKKVEVPVLVSGASSNHYLEAQMLIENLNIFVRPIYTNTPFYFFDLGLTASEKQKVCTVQPVKSDSDVMFCLQRYQGLIIDRSLLY